MSESSFIPESIQNSEKDRLRERILNQDAELMRAANAFANKIRSVPPDPACPNIEPRAYLVGGFVRDAILGKNPKDADLEVYGISQDRLEDLLKQLFGDRVNAVGQAFAVYKINLGEGLDLDVAMPRRESATGKGHKDFVVTGDPSMTAEEAAGRRDFTVNSMLADPLTGEIVDPYHGADDLESHLLRIVNPETFVEDPLRVYRALQFAARMNLIVEPKTKQLLKQMVEQGSLDHLPKERISEELKKLLEKSPKPSIGLELAKELGIIERYYPELAALEATPQEVDWHPEGNVWIHTMMVIDKAAQITRDPAFDIDEEHRLEVLLSALCHDVGKPSTTKESDGKIHSHGHEVAGKDSAKKLMSKWMFGKQTDQAVVAMTMSHLVPLQIIREVENGKMDERALNNALRRLIRNIHPCSWRSLLAVCASDIQGRGGDKQAQLEETEKLHSIIAQTIITKQLDKDPKKNLISGDDVLALGLKPGAQVGALIKAVETMRDNGEITTREEGLEALKTIVSP